MMTDKPSRPACFERALDFLGDPEASELLQYIEALEASTLPAVPPAKTAPTSARWEDIPLASIQHAYAKGWNECREAMLVGQLVIVDEFSPFTDEQAQRALRKMEEPPKG